MSSVEPHNTKRISTETTRYLNTTSSILDTTPATSKTYSTRSSSYSEATVATQELVRDSNESKTTLRTLHKSSDVPKASTNNFSITTTLVSTQFATVHENEKEGTSSNSATRATTRSQISSRNPGGEESTKSFDTASSLVVPKNLNLASGATFTSRPLASLTQSVGNLGAKRSISLISLLIPFMLWSEGALIWRIKTEHADSKNSSSVGFNTSSLKLRRCGSTVYVFVPVYTEWASQSLEP